MRLKALSLTVAFAIAGAVTAISATPAAYAGDGEGQMRKVERPFILWTKEEAAELRRRHENDPDFRKQVERMNRLTNTREVGGNATLRNLFNYMVLGDEQAGEREKRALLNFIGRKPEPLTWGIDVEDLTWHVGGPSHGDRHMRDEQTLNTLRYDVFYHELTDEQREGVEKALKTYVDFHLSGHQPWHPDFNYDRTSWLPNMHWPRAIGTHLMAVALQDEELIRKMFEGPGGFKWYFDEYLADGRFYMEEFGKHYSNLGTKLMYCEALEKLNLGQYGYGYTGKGGATVKKRLKMLFDIGYPRLEAPEGGMPRYPAVTMGDAGDTGFVNGYDARGRGGSRWWSTAHMNGPLPKMGVPGWFEVAHARWPDAHFDYFLAQLRRPGDDRYYPSPYFGLEPIDPADVTPPPAESYVAFERGFAMLRAEHSRDYWESPSPAVSLQFAMYYVHYVSDCFAIMQYVSHNRMLYDRMGRTARGYAGGDAWRDHVRGHSGVVVDRERARWVDRGERGVENHRVREDLDGPVRFTSVGAEGVYTDVNQERALFLTHEYMFDVFWLTSDRLRTYDWQVLVRGRIHDFDNAAWTPADNWRGDREVERPHLHNMKVKNPGADPWVVTVIQDEVNPESPRGVGVRIRMLPEEGTLVLGSVPPSVDADNQGRSVLVTRKAPATVFAALHEPFEGGPGGHAIEQFERIGQNDGAVAARIVGKAGSGIDDRVMVAWDEAAEEPVTFEQDGERFTFTGHGYIRIGREVVEAAGNFDELVVRVEGNPRLVLNGERTDSTIRDGRLHLVPTAE